jgi:hypothetical protein
MAQKIFSQSLYEDKPVPLPASTIKELSQEEIERAEET